MASSLVIDYTSRSFAEIRDDMLGQAISLLPAWTSRSPNDFGVVLVECLAAGTLVATPDGSMPIEEVRVGQQVLNATGIGFVTHTSTVLKTKVVQVDADGEQFYCSENHPFLTARGWVSAADLHAGDELISHGASVRVLRDTSTNELTDSRAEGGWEAVLRQSVLPELHAAEAHTHLRALPDGVRRSVEVGTSRSEVLLEGVLGRGETHGAGGPGVRGVLGGVHAEDAGPTGRRGALLLAKVPVGACTSEPLLGALGAERGTRWATSGSVHALAGVGRRVVPPVLDVTARCVGGGASLPGRSGEPGAANRGRGRRSGPLRGKGPAGSDPRRLADLVRVDRVEVHEPGSAIFTGLSGGSDQVTLYDLTVSGHPSFVVGHNRVLVHNCFAYMGDILNYYADRIANEAFLQTATQRRSVLALANMLDYRPNGAVAASVILSFTIGSGVGSTLVPAGTRVSTQTVDADPIYFETNVDLTLAGNTVSPAVTTGTVLATEGRTIFETIGTSDGSPSQNFLLTQNPVIEGSIDVFMNEGSGATTVWTYVDNLIEWGPYDRVYTTYTDENNVVHIIFGDGVNGKAPPSLAPIQTGYRVGGGSVGNVGPSTITTLDTTAAGVVSVTNTALAYGGQDAETLDQIRAAAPAALISLNRAVTLADYRALALKVQGIAKASPVSAVYSSVTLYIAPLGGGLDPTNTPILVPAAGKTAVSNYLATRTPAPTTVVLADPTYVQINIAITLVVAPQYNQKAIQSQVQAAVLNTLAYDTVDFGIRVTLGGTFGAITSVLGVGYASITLLARAGGSGAADIQLASNEIPVPGTLTFTTSGGILT